MPLKNICILYFILHTSYSFVLQAGIIFQDQTGDYIFIRAPGLLTMNNSNKLIHAYGKHGNIKQSNKSSIELKSPFKVVELSLGTDAYFKGLMCNIAN